MQLFCKEYIFKNYRNPGVNIKSIQITKPDIKLKHSKTLQFLVYIYNTAICYVFHVISYNVDRMMSFKTS